MFNWRFFSRGTPENSYPGLRKSVFVSSYVNPLSDFHPLDSSIPQLWDYEDVMIDTFDCPKEELVKTYQDLKSKFPESIIEYNGTGFDVYHTDYQKEQYIKKVTFPIRARASQILLSSSSGLLGPGILADGR